MKQRPCASSVARRQFPFGISHFTFCILRSFSVLPSAFPALLRRIIAVRNLRPPRRESSVLAGPFVFARSPHRPAPRQPLPDARRLRRAPVRPDVYRRPVDHRVAEVRNVGDVARFGALVFPDLLDRPAFLVLFFAMLFAAGPVAQEKDRRT